MELFPAIDLIDGCAVRLVQGDYAQKTVYSNSPLAVAQSFAKAGAKYMHVVDLDGAKNGGTPNLSIIQDIAQNSGLKVEVGGGIRSEAVIESYLNAGVYRVILGTAAVTNPDFLKEMVEKYQEKIAVGVDIKDGRVAIKGWTEVSEEDGVAFCKKMAEVGVKTIICTDISKDGLLAGTNLALYRELSEKVDVDIIASGGVSTYDDIEALRDMNLYGAILGKALYTGNIELEQAVALTKEEEA